MSANPYRLPSLPTLPGNPRGNRASAPAPRAERARRERVTEKSLTPYPPKPAWFVNSLAEWVIYHYFTAIKGWKRIGQGSPPVPGRSFYYQISLPALGVFVDTSSTRIDFLVPGRGLPGFKAVAIDPYNPYTHRHSDMDYLKRDVLAGPKVRVQLIWILTRRLEAGDFQVIERALAGADDSPRARRKA